MKRTLRFLLLFFIVHCIFCFVLCTAQTDAKQNTQGAANPLSKKDTTIIIEENDEEGEEEQLQERKKLWIEGMHRAAPGTDWRVIESKNMLDKYSRKMSAETERGRGTYTLRSAANCGNWSERGSDNQAGRCDETDYDSSGNSLYVMGDGGSLYKGVPDSASWTPLNDQLKFSNRIIKITKNASGGKRIITNIGLNMFYSDDNGIMFNPSSGISFPISWGGNYINQVEALNDAANTLFVITRPWDPSPWAPRFWLYKSVDHGQTWSQIYIFPYGDDNHLWMWKPDGQQNFLYALLNQDAANKSRVYKINRTTPVAQIDSTTDLPTNVNMQFGGNVTGVTTTLYALVNGSLYKSTNLGHNWTNLVSTPSGMSALGVSILDANKVFLGGVNAYRSTNGGSSWTLVNDWTAYYGSPSNRLHADIRKIGFFKRSNGSEFSIITCDAGTYRSDDYLSTVTNISLKGLRVGQYYDGITDHKGGLFLGSQDQGFQRADSTVIHSGILQFQQAISGDYGKLQLTRSNQTLWAEYPGGHMYYYYTSQGPYTTDWSMPGSTVPLSGWMLATAPVYPSSNNQIYLGGGNISGGAGSYIIKLTGTSGSISATQINYDFRGASGNGISAIGTTSLDSNRIYVAKEDGSFYYSANAGAAWNQTTSFAGPSPLYLFASCILASKKTNNLVWFAGSGYSNPAVYKSTNGGVTFSPMINGLPATLVYGLAANYNESFLFAATDAGPYVFSMSDTTWYPLDNGIAPAQSYWAVNYDSAANVVHFATYGRGLWDFVMSTPTVSINASPAGAICSGTNVTFTATPVNGGTAPVYQWKKNSLNVGTGNTYSTTSLANNDTVKCVMTSNAACPVPQGVATSNSIIETVNPSLPASVSISANPGNTICSGTSVTFTATPTNSGSSPLYVWKKNSVNVKVGAAAFYTTTTLANTDTIKCVMTSNAGCVSGSPAISNSIIMAVNPNVTAGVSISANPGNTICAGSSVTFTAVPGNGGTAPSYQWKKNSVNVATGSTYTTASISNHDTVKCVMTSNAPCVSGSPVTSNSIAMTVNACSVTLNLKAFLEGFYTTGGQMQAVADPINYPALCDTITVELHGANAPYNLAYSITSTININGNGNFIFPGSVQGNSYYIAIRHRNALETWSKDAVLFNSTVISFDFTSP